MFTLFNFVLTLSFGARVLANVCEPGDGVDGYMVVDSQYQRSAGYHKPDDVDWLCDRNIVPGWYRFTGHQGGDMITERLHLGSCGTIFPVWLNGHIPSEADGIVARQACVPALDNPDGSQGDDCAHSYDIQIRNCGDFRVYDMRQTAGCDEAYCIGTEVPCSDDTYSENMYTPGCREDVDECISDDDPHNCTNGACINTPLSYYCNCSSGYTGDYCEQDVDECLSIELNECVNGACENTDGSYNCVCYDGWTEEYCEQDIDECTDVDHLHSCVHGSCVNNDGGYTCNCTSDWEGTFCEDDIDECTDVDHLHSCDHGGCVNNDGGYTCNCTSGWEGTFCEDDIDECVLGIDGCANGSSTCVNTDGSYTCTCASGWTGQYCDTDIDECHPDSDVQHACFHGECVNHDGGYTCNCSVGWTGPVCNTDIDECADDSHACIDGTCVNSQGNYSCDCVVGFEGQFCSEEYSPEIDNDPTISYRVQENAMFSPRQVVMQCNNDHSEDVFYNVYWYLDDQLIVSRAGDSAVSSSDMPTELMDSEIDLPHGMGLGGKTLKCQVQPVYHRNGLAGSPRSASFWIGFELMATEGGSSSRYARDTHDDYDIILIEGDEPGKYVVSPTLPVLCAVGFDDCTLSLEVHIPMVDERTPAVCNGEVVDQLLLVGHTACRVEIPMTTDTSQTFSIEVAANTDNMYDGSHDMTLDIRTPAVHQSHWIWQNYTLPSARVYVMDRDPDIAQKVCKARNDPHMTTFDGRIYENQQEGAFVLYKHTSLPIEVHAYFSRCNGYATCVCGAAIRAGLDLFIYDRCLPNGAQRVTLTSCENHMLQIANHGHNRYVVTLPTGTQVKVWNSYIDVIPSLDDYGHTVGLCGTFDGDCSNEFVLSNGDTSTHPKAGQTSCDTRTGWDRYFHPDDFSLSWRVAVEDSLYNGVIPEVDGLHANIFCGCPEDGTTLCDYSSNPTINNCILSEFDETQRYFGQCSSRKRRSTEGGLGSADDVLDPVPDTLPFDPDFEPETPDDFPNGWTEHSATEYCDNYFNSSVVHSCVELDLVDYPYTMEACITDILLCGCTNYTDTHLDDLLSTCEREINKNMTLFYVSGSYNPPQILDQLCPLDCSGHGVCINGVCECHDGFSGTDCSRDVNKVPELYGLPLDGLCDLDTRPCVSTPVLGDEFHKGNGLKCQVSAEVTTYSDDVVRYNAVVSSAEYDHNERVLCPLPRVSNQVKSFSYYTSVANDGLTFSQPKKLLVYNSNCMSCLDGACTANAGSCFIEGECYSHNERSSSDNCKVCDVSQSSYQFSDVCGDGSNGGGSSGGGSSEGGSSGGGLSTLGVALVACAVVAIAAVAATVGIVAVKKFSKKSVNAVTPRDVAVSVEKC